MAIIVTMKLFIGIVLLKTCSVAQNEICCDWHQLYWWWTVWQGNILQCIL